MRNTIVSSTLGTEPTIVAKVAQQHRECVPVCAVILIFETEFCAAKTFINVTCYTQTNINKFNNIIMHIEGDVKVHSSQCSLCKH